MPRAKEHSAEEIIPKLRTAELEIAKGRTAAEAAKPATGGAPACFRDGPESISSETSSCDPFLLSA